MKTLEQIGEELQGYDPQALRASDVNAFLAKLVEPVRQTEMVSIFAALDRVLAQGRGLTDQRAPARQLGDGRLCL
jgi:molybdopterin molybdotransferase